MQESAAAGYSYDAICKLAEDIAKRTKLRDLASIEPLIEAMGGKVIKQTRPEWEAQQALSFECSGPKKFTVYVAKEGGFMNEVSYLSALCHYILHAMEGQCPLKISRFDSGRQGKEGLWFAMAVLIPDAAFALAARSQELTDDSLAEFFCVPADLVRLKRKLISQAAA